MRRTRWSVALIAFGLGAIAATIGTSVSLATGNNETTIHACVKPSGDLRLVDDPTDCKKREHIVSWNTTGPPGPPPEHREHPASKDRQCYRT
jgi:hypothetical protein